VASCIAFVFRLTILGRATMLKLPAYGYAKRVDDAVARAMTILKSREDYTATATPTTLPRPPQGFRNWNSND